MNEKILLVGIAVLLISAGLSGCINSSESSGKSVDVTILKTYYKADEQGSTQFYLDIKIKNNQEHPGGISYPHLTTKTGHQYALYFEGGEGNVGATVWTKIPPGNTLNKTLRTKPGPTAGVNKSDTPVTLTYGTFPAGDKYSIDIK